MARKRSKRWLLGALAVGAGWWWRPFRVRVEGHSMSPAIEPGDWLVAVRFAHPSRGSIVVVEHPERPGFELVKRVAGVPGETIGALTLGPDEYWVTGDRPGESTDSRWFGPVPRAHLLGIAVLRFWPLRRLHLLDRNRDPRR